jgi:hypothetical protein
MLMQTYANRLNLPFRAFPSVVSPLSAVVVTSSVGDGVVVSSTCLVDSVTGAVVVVVVLSPGGIVKLFKSLISSLS